MSAAGQRTLPVVDALDTLFTAGLPRGVTLTSSGSAARSFAFTLIAAASQAGAWLAVLGLEGPGWRAAAELGVATNRIVHVDVSRTEGRDADCIAAALDGFDLVLVGPQIHLKGVAERRLSARARERGAVLIGVHDGFAGDDHKTSIRPLDAVADLRVTTRDGHWQGLGAGTGRLTGRPVETTVEGKRLPGRHRSTRLWLPGPDGMVAPMVEPVPLPVESRDDPAERRVERSA